MTDRQQTILVVDDEPVIVRFLRASLQANDFRVLVAIDGATAIDSVERYLPDLVILDIAMPNIDGFEVCKRLREWSQIPIIMLSARGDERDKVKCLELGADDYVTKPFGVDELAARVRAVLRRTQETGDKNVFSSFASGNLKINFAQRKVTMGDNEIRLTPTEYCLLQELALNAGKVLTYAHLLKQVWGTEYEAERQYLHVFINRLRAKLELVSTAQTYITTVPGVGYRLEAIP